MYAYSRENAGYLHSVGVPFNPATFFSDLRWFVDIGRIVAHLARVETT